VQAFNHPLNRVRRRSAEQGITLIELMVAITVGLILLTGIVQLFVSNKQAYRIQEGANVLNENSRYAMDQLEYSIRMAGHWGGAKPSSIAVGTAKPATDCTESPAFNNDDAELAVGYGIEGFEGAAASPLDCIPDADYRANTDVLILRYAGAERVSDADIALPAMADTQFVRVRAGGGADIFDGDNFIYDGAGPPDIRVPSATDDNKDLISNYVANVEIYFIRNCASNSLGVADVCDAADDTIPTLARLVLRDGVFEQQDVVAGVEQLQVLYGVDDNQDRSANRYVNATTVEAGTGKGPEWAQVVDTRVSVVVRNTERDVTFRDTKTYRLYGGAAGDGLAYNVAAGDQSFRRKVYNASVQSRNMTRNIR
jgi:type IV pilus assembly protein PilW